jgi:hypothetical protein
MSLVDLTMIILSKWTRQFMVAAHKSAFDSLSYK